MSVKHLPESKAIGVWGWAMSPSKVAAKDPHALEAWRSLEAADRFKTRWIQDRLEKYKKVFDGLRGDPDGLEESLKTVGKFALKVEGGTPEYTKLINGLSPAQKAYYLHVQDSLKELADWLRIPQEDRIVNYVGHMFDKDDLIGAWQKVLEKAEGLPLSKIAHPQTPEGLQAYEKIQSITNLPFGRRGIDSLPKELINNFLLERKTGILPEDFSIDKMYRLYIMRAARTGFDNPVMQLIKQDLPLIEDPAVRRFMMDYTHDFFSGAKVGTAEDFSRLWMSLMFNLKLGGNLRSPLTNLTQNLFTVAELGPEATATGGSLLWRSKAARELFDMSGHSATIPQFYRYDTASAAGSLSQRKMPGVKGITYDAALESLGKVAGSMFNGAEFVNRGTAFLGGIYKALRNEGISSTKAIEIIEKRLEPIAGTPLMEKALDFADNAVVKTQFRYGKVDLPSLFRKSPVTRALFQFQSFGLKATEFIVDLWKNNPEKLMAFLAMQYGASEAGKHLFGADLRDVLGVGVDPIAAFEALKKLQKGDVDSPTLTKAIGEAFPLLNGRTGVLPGSPGTRFGGPAAEFAMKTQETLEKLGVAVEKGKPFSDIGKLVLDGLGGTFSWSQGKRFYQAYRAFMAEREQGEVDNPKFVSVILGFPNYRWIAQREYLRLHRMGKTNMAEEFKAQYEKDSQERLKVPQSLVTEAIQEHAEKYALQQESAAQPNPLPDQLNYLLRK